jgi:rubrerythrin
MSYHVENPRFKELPKQLIVHEDGYMDAYKREGVQIIDYVYTLDKQECDIAYKGNLIWQCQSCGEEMRVMISTPNYCPHCGKKAKR